MNRLKMVPASTLIIFFKKWLTNNFGEIYIWIIKPINNNNLTFEAHRDAIVKAIAIACNFDGDMVFVPRVRKKCSRHWVFHGALHIRFGFSQIRFGVSQRIKFTLIANNHKIRTNFTTVNNCRCKILKGTLYNIIYWLKSIFVSITVLCLKFHPGCTSKGKT